MPPSSHSHSNDTLSHIQRDVDPPHSHSSDSHSHTHRDVTPSPSHTPTLFSGLRCLGGTASVQHSLAQSGSYLESSEHCLSTCSQGSKAFFLARPLPEVRHSTSHACLRLWCAVTERHMPLSPLDSRPLPWGGFQAEDLTCPTVHTKHVHWHSPTSKLCKNTMPTHT